MKKDGYFVECSKCGSYDVKVTEPTCNNVTKKISQTWICKNCGNKSIKMQ